MQTIWAKTVLTANGWVDDVSLSIGQDGLIVDLRPNTQASGAAGYGALVPAPVNLHSHGFQRAMAGLTEGKGPDPHDSFWSWRKLMFSFLDYLEPDSVQAITAFAQMQMLEAGFSTVCEFHYLHHQPGGEPYENIAEMSERIVAAAAETGIGLTLLPVLYQFGGCDGRPLGAGQVRFGNTPDRFADLVAKCGVVLQSIHKDSRLGVAPHSLRAVSPDGLAEVIDLLPERPLHLHLAEQMAEVEEIVAAYGARPVEWLLNNFDVDAR
ncbi:MAG: amidohydrolase family protein, partial [Paracoccaceae bacterium]